MAAEVAVEGAIREGVEVATEGGGDDDGSAAEGGDEAGGFAFANFLLFSF